MSTTQNNNGFKTYTAGEALLEGRRVKLNSAGAVVYADAADYGIGVAQQDRDSGASVLVKHYNDTGTFLLTVTDASITAGDNVYADADGKVTTTAGTILIGQTLETAAEANALIECSVNSLPVYQVVAAGIHDWAGGAATTDSISVVGLVATDIVTATLVARASTETLVLVGNDAANDQIDLTLSANGTNTTTKISYSVLRAL